ncbi:MAG: serine dehydratase subunit alpha family protein [Ruminococcaceae bacterium]|nr:serine dehydratase subunit alpha family protein [Oscillospiraceae bacterium]
MPLDQTIINTYTSILREELVPAMGCTEPIAIAYAAAILRHALGDLPEKLEVSLSGNIIKNVKSVIVPATGGMHGIAAAVAAGIISGCPDKKLEVLGCLTPRDHPRIAAYIQSTPMQLTELDTPHPFEVILTGYSAKDTATVHLVRRHTNIASVTRNGEDVTSRYADECVLGSASLSSPDANGEEDCQHAAARELLTVENIVKFADEADLTELRPLLKRQMNMNMAIAEEGLQNEWGAAIGRLLYGSYVMDRECLGDAALDPISLRNKARAYAAAGSDARMSGCELPVCILSGSGNQGITASVPVVIYGRAMKLEEDTILRGLLVSSLITIHQKTGIGCLSAYCGAISAGCGCGAGICYLHGGRYYEIAHTLVNAIAILSGTICDGAKPSCAAKIAMAVEAGIMGYEMMKSGHQFYGGDGIVTKGVENTIRNVGRLARDGMSGTDREIIRIMLGE